MTFWYNASSTQNGYASANCTKWNEINARVVFAEFGLKEDDDFFYLFGYAKEISPIKNFKDNNWKFEPQNTVVKLAKKVYTKTYQGNSTEIKQSPIEKFAIDALTTWDKTKVYTGTIHFQHLYQYESYVQGTLDPIMKTAFIAGMFHTSALTTQPEHIKLDDFVPQALSPANNKQFGAVRGQIEYEKLKDKERFLIEFFASAFPDEKVENIADLIKLSAKEDYWTVTGLFNELFGSSYNKK